MWGFVYRKKLMYYIKSSANAKNVTLKGNIIEQYPPPTAYTPKNATTDNKNKIQYKPVDFFLVVIIKNIFCKYTAARIILCNLFGFKNFLKI